MSDAADTSSSPTDVAPVAPVAPVASAAELTHVATVAAPLDLDGIERDLADVELALARLDSGEYWTDEVSGGAIPDEFLEEHPTARRLSDR